VDVAGRASILPFAKGPDPSADDGHGGGILIPPLLAAFVPFWLSAGDASSGRLCIEAPGPRGDVYEAMLCEGGTCLRASTEPVGQQAFRAGVSTIVVGRKRLEVALGWARRSAASGSPIRSPDDARLSFQIGRGPRAHLGWDEGNPASERLANWFSEGLARTDGTVLWSDSLEVHVEPGKNRIRARLGSAAQTRRWMGSEARVLFCTGSATTVGGGPAGLRESHAPEACLRDLLDGRDCELALPSGVRWARLRFVGEPSVSSYPGWSDCFSGAIELSGGWIQFEPSREKPTP